MSTTTTKLDSEITPKLNPIVFWPPFSLLLAAVVLNLIEPQAFAAAIGFVNAWLLKYFGWLYTVTAMTSLGLCVWIGISRFGKVRLGGRHAKPLMSFWNWFAITLCTTIATGILFWSTAEPLIHYTQPPAFLGIAGKTVAAERFAMSALFLHWTIVPYSIYCVASIMFAFAFYNMQLPFSLGSMLVPLFGERRSLAAGVAIDSICLYALVAGMAATLGTGILTISGGLNSIIGVPRTSLVWGLISIAIVCTFVISSATGLMQGIRVLSDINAKGLFALGLFVLVVGPWGAILFAGLWGLLDFAWVFIRIGLFEGLRPSDHWALEWSIFYWAVWMAWTPVTACFLGRIAYGRTIREFLVVNLLLSSLFAFAWMAVWGASTLHMEKQGGALSLAMDQDGREAVSFALISNMQWGKTLVIFYVLSAFVCFVTSADSNTTAMASLSSKGVTLEQPEAKTWLKIVWGTLVGTVAWVMISFADVEGVKILSNLGGFPAACLLLLVVIALFRVSLNPDHYNAIERESPASAKPD
ncbi:MAG: BCCT family transporter [Planctomycetaceae bacterium]|nr:BCCT family transporter [Planctomycetaceae bacterium]